MAEIWIKMRHDLSTNPKVIAIAEALKLDEDTVVGTLHRMWCWADKFAKHNPDPNHDCLRVEGVSPARLSKELGRKGFAEVLLRPSIDWLHERDGGIEFPRASLHMSSTAKSRALNTRRKQAERDAPPPPPTPDPSRSQRDKDATPTRHEHDTSATRGRMERESKKTPPPQPALPVAPTPPAANGAGGGGDPDLSPCAMASSVAVLPASPPRSPEATALLDTLIGAGVWTSVATDAVDQAGVELVGACMALWHKTRTPTPELLGSRLRELVKPGSDIRRQCEQSIADLARKRAKAAQRAAPTTPTPIRDIPRRHPPPATSAPVPGLTDHPAFARLDQSAPAAPSAAPRLEPATP